MIIKMIMYFQFGGDNWKGLDFENFESSFEQDELMNM
jgi:hypothetical protein